MDDQQLEQAIQRIYGEDHFLVAFREQEPVARFPVGTHWWVVEHESHTCPHTPRCHWFGLVFLYKSRVTLLKESEIALVTPSLLNERITGAMEN